MSDPFARLKQKENRDKKRAKKSEMGVSGRSVKLLGRISEKKSREAMEKQRLRRLKEQERAFIEDDE